MSVPKWFIEAIDIMRDNHIESDTITWTPSENPEAEELKVYNQRLKEGVRLRNKIKPPGK